MASVNWNFKLLNPHRIKNGDYGSNDTDTYGAFYVPYDSYELKVLATDGQGLKPEWEHVSVSMPNRCPNWKEMCFIKDLFWGKEETVLQIHPPASKYVNQHPHCLHMWKKKDGEFELPPLIYVGI